MRYLKGYLSAKMKKLFSFFLLMIVAQAQAQENSISGEVINSYDSSRVPYAKVSLAGEKVQITTDAKGRFSLPANLSAGRVRFRVAALGIDSIFDFRAPFPKLFSLWVTPKGFEIGATIIRGLSAKEVVAEAIRRIPENYPKDGLLYYGFYRQYYRVDSAFRNLIEARVATLVRPLLTKNKLEAEYRFLPLAMRRQRYREFPVESVGLEDGLAEELFQSDPVYFQDKSSFMPSVFRGSTFIFDTLTSNRWNYVIRYYARTSSDDHGIFYQSDRAQNGRFPQECYESGELTIERKSFAFVHIERHSARNPGFSYEPPYLTFVLPRSYHYEEFLTGHLDIWYKRQGDYWILARLRRGFTNEFFRSSIKGGGRECAIGQFYEWKTDSASRYVPAQMLPLFYKDPLLQFVEMPADTLEFSIIPPFFFFPKKKVYDAVGWKGD